MRRIVVSLIAMALIALPGGLSQAAVISLFEYALNVDGMVYDPWYGDPIPAGLADLTGFNEGSGLGTIVLAFNTPGIHYAGAFFDHNIDEDVNGFFNEYGSVAGAPSAGQSWEIDEQIVTGDIYDNLLASALDNHNAIPAGMNDDVSMAMAWSFVLSEGQTATAEFTLTGVVPLSGFYLAQKDLNDPDPLAGVYLTTLLRITGEPYPVPDQGVWLPVMAALFALMAALRKRLAV